MQATGVSPAVSDVASTAPILGHPWTVDWRDSSPVTPDYQGAGDQAAYLNLASATDWSPYTGLVSSNPIIMGYGGGELVQIEPQHELRAGQTIPFPTSGQMGENSEVPFLTLLEEEGFDVGLQLWQPPAGQRMIFQQPPPYGAQTYPIPAVGI